MGKISDEIRRWCEDLDSKDVLCATFDLYSIANRIDAEMIELPKSADGAPIHVGDTVYTTDGSKAHAERICIMANTTHVKCAFSDGRIIEFQPTELTHTRPDSWERIADELEGLSVDSSDNYYVSTHCSKLADRIRKLAKEQGDE